jgi:prolyl-tRNA synthetase
MVGAVVMVHGDDQGLVLPPKLAPYQVVVVPIWKDEDEHAAVLEALERVKRIIDDDVRVHVDDRDAYSPGWKFHEWEMRGVPLRLELGPRDVESGQVVLARRDVFGRAGKSMAPIGGGLKDVVAETLEEIQSNLFRQALAFREERTYDPVDYDAFKEAVAMGFANAWWCGDAACEAQIKEETKATLRCIPLEQESGTGPCIRCGRASHERAVFARAY